MSARGGDHEIMKCFKVTGISAQQRAPLPDGVSQVNLIATSAKAGVRGNLDVMVITSEQSNETWVGSTGRGLATLAIGLIPRAVWREFVASLSPMTLAALAAMVLMGALLVADRSVALVWSMRNAREQRLAEAAWDRYGSRWLGIYTELDEAIAGLRNAVGLYVRVPLIPAGRLSWIPNRILAPVVELPLNYLLRLRARKEGRSWAPCSA